jgi:outer membrane protein OmpA-like peptidoglycan-associated protein
MVQTQATDQQTSPGSLFSQRTDPGQIAPNSDPETTQSDGAVDVPVNNVTPNAVITLGALAHGVRTATVNGQSVHIVAATGFSGLISQPVTVQDQGATVTVHLTMVVNPASPRGAHFTTARHARTLVTWSSASGATGYTVTVGGKTICHTTSTHRSCLIPSLAGPKSTVKVMSNGGDATTSALVAATYVAPAKAVVIGSVGFGTRDIDLTKVTRPQVDAFARQIARQGFNRIVIRGYAASVATDKASVARQWRDSRLRAFAVANELKTQLHAAGSHASVTVTWFGATNPIANNLSFFGRIQNRRADIVVA